MKRKVKKMQARELSELLTPEEAGHILKISPGTLTNWRVQGRGPRFVRTGRRIRYTRNDLAAYVAARTQQSTSETD